MKSCSYNGNYSKRKLDSALKFVATRHCSREQWQFLQRSFSSPLLPRVQIYNVCWRSKNRIRGWTNSNSIPWRVNNNDIPRDGKSIFDESVDEAKVKGELINGDPVFVPVYTAGRCWQIKRRISHEATSI